MMRSVRYVAACEALAESFEQSGRLDLAALCDKAAFWLEGGPRIDHLPVDEIVTACREALVTDRQHCSDGDFLQSLSADVARNLQRIARQTRAAAPLTDQVEVAARLRAIAILTEKLF